MDETQIVDLAHSAMYIASVTALPILIVCLVVGLIVSIFETITQIHEQSLTFVPKVIAVVLLIAIMGGWMVSELEGFTREIFAVIAKL